MGDLTELHIIYIYIYKVGANVVPIPPVVAAAYRPIHADFDS